MKSYPFWLGLDPIAVYSDCPNSFERSLHETVIMVIDHAAYDAVAKERDEARAQAEKLAETLADVIRNSHDIMAKKHCSQSLQEYKAWKNGGGK